MANIFKQSTDAATVAAAQAQSQENQAIAAEQNATAATTALANKPVPVTPAVAVAQPILDPNSPSLVEAQNAQAAGALQRTGRASTIIGQQAAAPARSNSPADTYSSRSLG